MKVNESGRSMIEMLGVLAIIGVLSVGGIAGYSKAMSKYRVNKTIDQVSHIAANTRILFSSQKNYDDLGNSTNSIIIDKAKLFPQEMKNTDGNYYNPFSGTVTMVAAKRFKGETDNKAFVVTYNGIPQEACIDLATIDWGTGSGGGLVALGVNKAVDTMTTDATSADAENLQCKGDDVICGGNAVMEVDKAVAACTAGDTNYLSFKFY
jgi:Tfp pilus assembly protein PilE